jgi:hypothetical protein
MAAKLLIIEFQAGMRAADGKRAVSPVPDHEINGRPGHPPEPFLFSFE